jgi:glycosyltransferase involved in cell wall biosynthesis
MKLHDKALQISPLVSVILVAKNEAHRIEQSIVSLLNQNYKKLEIVVVNDRSTDQTGAILQTISQQHQNVKTIEIIQHEPNWLGKLYAMYQGAKIAKGEWLLFSDGDVIYEPATISSAMHYVLNSNLDNLTLTPRMISKDLLLDVSISAGTIAFYLDQKPWHAINPTSEYFAGVGAFNLLRRKDYFEIDGHQSFASCVLDDLKLGQQLKRNGCKQKCLDGTEFIRLNWYTSSWDMVLGIEKNGFAFCRFSWLRLISRTLLGFVIYLLPLLVLFSSNKFIQLGGLACILVTLKLYYCYSKRRKISYWQMLIYPYGIILGTIACWRSAIKIMVNKGIYWRNSFYPIENLKKYPL